jgi:hypothetical protein
VALIWPLNVPEVSSVQNGSIHQERNCITFIAMTQMNLDVLFATAAETIIWARQPPSGAQSPPSCLLLTASNIHSLRRHITKITFQMDQHPHMSLKHTQIMSLLSKGRLFRLNVAVHKFMLKIGNNTY